MRSPPPYAERGPTIRFKGYPTRPGKPRSLARYAQSRMSRVADAKKRFYRPHTQTLLKRAQRLRRPRQLRIYL